MDQEVLSIGHRHFRSHPQKREIPHINHATSPGVEDHLVSFGQWTETEWKLRRLTMHLSQATVP